MSSQHISKVLILGYYSTTFPFLVILLLLNKPYVIFPLDSPTKENLRSMFPNIGNLTAEYLTLKALGTILWETLPKTSSHG